MNMDTFITLQNWQNALADFPLGFADIMTIGILGLMAIPFLAMAAQRCLARVF